MNPPLRIGHGYDLHRLELQPPAGAGRAFIIGGVTLPHTHGPIAHSDGDALYHAITDALLGALALPDIGQLFPDDDPSNQSKDSSLFLAAAGRRVAMAGYEVQNIDATVVLERPRLSPSKDQMRANVARVLGIELSRVNVKGKTHEGLDALGEGRAIEVHCVALLSQSAAPKPR